MWVEPVPERPSLYVHVPFCARKCEYCAFYSEPSGADLKDRYVRALVREMEWVASEMKGGMRNVQVLGAEKSNAKSSDAVERVPTTIFFGGGTPSLLTLGHWKQIFEAMERLGLLGAEEWTIECNPATVSLEKARLWRSYGVNRVSMGVQSFTPALLERLGRIHTRKMAYASYEVLRASGFDNVNLDLMFAIPGQTLAMWRETLAEAIAMQPEHLACYEVIYEEDTPLYRQLQAGEFSVDEDLACAMYEELLECAAENGFAQYEVSNFARGRPLTPTLSPSDGAREKNEIPQLACRHNVNYWRGGPYYGLGPSAASYIGGVRTQNVSNTKVYCSQIEVGQRPLESRDELPPLQRAGELAAFGLRMNAGWPLKEFQARTGFDLRQEWKAECEKLVSQDWACLDADRFYLTSKGLRFADAAGEMFLR